MSVYSNDQGRSFDLAPEEVYNALSPLVYRLAVTRTKNRQDAEDVTQEVFLRYVRSAPAIENEEHLKAWFIRVTLRCTKGFLVKRGRVSTEELPVNLGVSIPEKSSLFYAVSSLPKEMRTVIYLYYYEGYTTEQIAKAVGVKQGTVKSRLSRARAKLKIELT